LALAAKWLEDRRQPRPLASRGDAREFRVTVTFAEQGGKAMLTMQMIFASAEERERVVKEVGAVEGANQTLDRLEEDLAKAWVLDAGAYARKGGKGMDTITESTAGSVEGPRRFPACRDRAGSRGFVAQDG